MRRFGVIVAAVALAVGAAFPPPAQAEGRALLGLEQHGWGGWAGPQFKPTALAGTFCLYGGGPVVFLAGPSLGFGLNVGLPDGDAGGLSLRYAGARGRYILSSSEGSRLLSRLHLSLALDVGGGVAAHDGRRVAAAVIEPEALAAISLWPSFRVGLGASYRLAVLLAPLGGFSALDLSGPAGVVQLQYGRFPPSRSSHREANR